MCVYDVYLSKIASGHTGLRLFKGITSYPISFVRSLTLINSLSTSEKPKQHPSKLLYTPLHHRHGSDFKITHPSSEARQQHPAHFNI